MTRQHMLKSVRYGGLRSLMRNVHWLHALAAATIIVSFGPSSSSDAKSTAYETDIVETAARERQVDLEHRGHRREGEQQGEEPRFPVKGTGKNCEQQDAADAATTAPNVAPCAPAAGPSRDAPHGLAAAALMLTASSARRRHRRRSGVAAVPDDVGQSAPALAGAPDDVVGVVLVPQTMLLSVRRPFPTRCSRTRHRIRDGVAAILRRARACPRSRRDHQASSCCPR